MEVNGLLRTSKSDFNPFLVPGHWERGGSTCSSEPPPPLQPLGYGMPLNNDHLHRVFIYVLKRGTLLSFPCFIAVY